MTHSVALTAKGFLYSWGRGPATGQIPPGDTPVVPTPRLIHEGLQKVTMKAPLVQITAGPMHTIALQLGGDIYIWGSSSEGRLAPANLPSGEDQWIPLKIQSTTFSGWRGKPHETVEQIEQSLKQPGEQKNLQDRNRMSSSEGTSAVPQVACGGMHSVMLNDEKLWVWGASDSGQLGLEESQLSGDMWSPIPLLLPIGIRMIALGLDHSIAITTKGTLLSWGNGENGQLGTGKCRNYSTPQEITGVDTAFWIAAGEEHSACILESGPLFTWGNGSSGKLGHGGTFTDGLQLLPRQVNISDKLNRVRCGSQHTAITNEDGQLFTFGAGWFGRLGHGDTDNRYSPHVVKSTLADMGNPPEFLIQDVQCGAYHTCIVSRDADLWVCGRANCVCQGEDTLKPIQMSFRKSDVPVKVTAVSAGEHHSLAVSSTGELWGWGDNRRGQLALSTDIAFVPSPERIVQLQNVQDTVAAPAHSVAILKNGEVCCWGSISSGRLGIGVKNNFDAVQRVPEILDYPFKTNGVANGQDPKSTALALENKSSGGQKSTPRENSASPKRNIAKRTSALSPDQDTTNLEVRYPFLEVQTLLRNEPEENREDQLRKDEAILGREYGAIMNHIFHLWDPSSSNDGEPTERVLRQLYDDYDTSLCRTLRYLRLSDKEPFLDKLTTPEEILLQMHKFEEMCWVLQQQPCYLANLAACLPQLNESPECQVYFRVVSAIYEDLEDSRVRGLCKALLRLLLTQELRICKTIDFTFDPGTSKAMTLMKQFLIHRAFREYLTTMLNPDDDNGIIARIVNWTVEQSQKIERKAGGSLALFMTKQDDFIDVVAKGWISQSEVTTQRFQDEVKELQKFVEESLVPFVEQLVLPDDMQCLIYKAFTVLEVQPYAFKHKRTTRFYEPLTSLVIGSLLVGSLELYESWQMRFLKLKVNQIVRKQAEGFMSDDPQEIAQLLEDKIQWNINSLAIFLQQCAANTFEEVDIRKAAVLVRGALCKVLEKAVPEFFDHTETQCTVDVYTSHYSLEQHKVTVSTYDLLKLSNMMIENLRSVVLDSKDDYLTNLLTRINAVKHDDPSAGPAPWPPHIIFIMSTDPKYNVQHNFTINPRFLEFYQSGPEEPVFCRFSQAPVPRFLCAADQKKRSGIRVVKVYLADVGWECEGTGVHLPAGHKVYPYRELEVLLREVEFDSQAHDFLGFRNELEDSEIKAASVEGKKPDYGMIQKVELGKMLIDRCLSSGRKETELFDFIKDALEARAQHRQYLALVQDGKIKIADARRSYEEELANRVTLLREMIALSESSDAPQLLKNFTQGHGCRLTMKAVADAKRKDIRNDPTADFRQAGGEAGDDAARTAGNDDDLMLARPLPLATLDMGYLRAKKVVSRMGHGLSDKVNRALSFTFRFQKSGDWKVEVLLKEGKDLKVLREFEITWQELETMRHGAKTAKMPFADGFVVLNCFKLVQLLTRISASGI
eukprot:gnl/MRDRNA2_/MRDRNA2_113899_c0_seq1.p1 gnl/MRDRNA2_/MRDRNA2_113899_c0~~gnl/MRDRNA2_/MRDRNA2_113899_c0_seq1.p1  ORF type:complete len:1623 (+),score=304.88 gnl/MRDRNA2_/MRDRNA2_113899_c0_seq1:483-4871(+)